MRAYEFIFENEQSYNVLLTNTPELKDSAMTRFIEEFNPVIQYLKKPDGSPSSVEYELRDVNWNTSAGIFKDNKICVGALAMRPNYTILDYLNDKPSPNFDKYLNSNVLKNMTAGSGEALVIDSDVPTIYKTKILMLVFKVFRNNDYLWGLAHRSLDNMDFWNKHSITLGMHEENNLFVLPISVKAKQLFKELS